MYATSDIDLVAKQSTDSKAPKGIVPGIVEYVHDPQCMGRVRVRIATMHGDDSTTTSEKLPWAMRSELGGGGFNYGSFTPLLPGAGVWVDFIDGDKDQPVIVGTYSSMPAKRGLFGQTKPELHAIAASDSSLGPWKGKEITTEDGATRGESEIPQEARETAFNEPTVWVPFKTWKGASLTIQERDGLEKLELIDRFGQGIQMKSRVTPELNQYNKMQRGMRSVFSGNQFDYREHTDNRETSISFRDAAQQGLLTEAKRDEERTKISSKQAKLSDKSSIDFDMGANVHSIELGAGHQRSVIECKKNGKPMVKILLDSQRGILDFYSEQAIRLFANKVILEANEFVVKGNTLIDGNLVVSNNLTVVGETVTGSPERDSG